MKLEHTRLPTLGDFGDYKLGLLCEGLGLTSLGEHALEVFAAMSAPWADWPIGHAPAWPSDITDDGTPFEFSVAFDGGQPKLRFLVEAQEAPLTTASAWLAGLKLTEQLGRWRGVDLTRFRRVHELFAPPPGATARFAIYHAVTLSSDAPPSFKVYMNPQIGGIHGAPQLVDRALRLLGFERARETISARFFGRPERRIVYFSLDLIGSGDARVKIYVAHDRATVDDVEADLEGLGDYRSGDARAWISHFVDSEGPFDARPMLSCCAFTSTSANPAITLHIPVRCYAPSDEESVARVAQLLAPDAAKRLTAGASRMAARPLDMGRSLATYGSVRRMTGRLNVTVYLAPEAYAISAPRIRDGLFSRQRSLDLGVRGASERVDAQGT